MTEANEAGQRKAFVLERTFKASPERVWRMWTTKEGLEKWWSPEGFESEVLHLDVRVGGRFEIRMTAVVPEIIRHLESIGVGRSNVARGDYTEVEIQKRLAYDNQIDFVECVKPYAVKTVVQFSPSGSGTRMTVENAPMHSPHWSDMARQGWEQQLGKLERALA